MINQGIKAVNKNAMGNIITLFSNEPLEIAHKTGSSLEETNTEAFSAFTAKSSPKIPAVFLQQLYSKLQHHPLMWQYHLTMQKNL